MARYYYYKTVYIGGIKDNIYSNIWKGLINKGGRNLFGWQASTKSETIASSAIFGNLVVDRLQSQTRNISQKRLSSFLHISLPFKKQFCLNSPIKKNRD